jgi:orotidine-5'-phosphate decarboxylase
MYVPPSTTMAVMSARDKLIVALDLPSADAATRLAERLHGHVGMFKVGSELFTAEGPVLARYLVAVGEKVFLDLKFHDIPNTVRAAAREAAQLGVTMLNVHASGGRKMMEAALEGVQAAASRRHEDARPRVLAVTLLTSLESSDLEKLGLAGTPEDVVVRLARLAQEAGLDGVVASPREIAAVRAACGPRFVIVTPGIRPAHTRRSGAAARPATGAADDQVRIATPEVAIQAGADYLVVGRPITEAPEPVAAADAIVAEMEKAVAGRLISS